MDNRVGLSQLEEQGKQSQDPQKRVQEAVPEGKVTTSQFAEISTPTARPLAQVKTAIPFDPWPNKVTVDEIKVSMITIRFFGTEIVESLLIKDITDVNVSKVPFFASLSITGGEHKGFPGGKGEPLGALQANFLHPDDADHVRRVILGLIIFNDRKVDTSKIELQDLLKQAEELGRARK